MRLRTVILGGLLVATLGFALFAFEHMLPPRPYGLADDWRVFYAASMVVQHGGDPYAPAPIHAAEQAAEHYEHAQTSLDDFTNLPVVALMLRAFTWMPFWSSFVVFTAAGLVVAVLALLAWMRELRWPPGWLWLLGATCSWPMLLGFFSGQFDALLLGATVASVVLMRRDRPWAAGVCMAAVLLKPHLLWPLPLLLFAAWLPEGRRAWRFLAATAGVLGVGTALGFLLVPRSSGFIGHLLGFGSRVSSEQPDLSGLPGMLLHVPGGAAAGVALAAAGLCSVLAMAVAAVSHAPLRRLDERQRALVPLAGLAVWLACAPYAHPNDDVVLFPLLALLITPAARALGGRALAAGLLAAAALATAFVLAPPLGDTLVAAGAVACIVWWRRATLPGVTAMALVSMAILPAIWPFHVLSVPVAPLAVALTAVAGVLALRAALRLGAARSVGEGQRRGRVGGIVVEAPPALAAEAAGRH